VLNLHSGSTKSGACMGKAKGSSTKGKISYQTAKWEEKKKVEAMGEGEGTGGAGGIA